MRITNASACCAIARMSASVGCHCYTYTLGPATSGVHVEAGRQGDVRRWLATAAALSWARLWTEATSWHMCCFTAGTPKIHKQHTRLPVCMPVCAVLCAVSCPGPHSAALQDSHHAGRLVLQQVPANRPDGECQRPTALGLLRRAKVWVVHRPCRPSIGH